MFGIIKNIARHSIVYGLSDVLSRAIGFIMIPLYTYYLTPANYGTLELLDLTSYIVGMLIAMGIAGSVIRFYYEYGETEKRNQMISVALITLWSVSALSLAILFLCSRQISNLVFQSPDYYRMYNIVFISMVIGLSNEIPLTLLRIKEKSTIYVTISLSKLVLNLSLNILFIVKFKMGIMGILYSGLITAFVIGSLITFFTVRQVKLTYSFSILRAMLKYSLPLMGSWFGMFVLNFGDRFFLQRMTTLSDVGIYSLAYKFGMLPNVLVLSPFMMIWAPKQYNLLKEPNVKEIFSTVFTYFFFIELFIGLGIIILIKDAINLVAAPQYHEAYKFVPIILLAYIAYGTFLFVQFGIHLEKKTKYLAYATLIGAIINIAGNFILIHYFGILGAAISTLISFSFLLSFIYWPSQRLYRIPYDKRRLLIMSLVAIGLYILAYFISPESRALSIILKSIIALSFPFVLYVIGFYTKSELDKIKSGMRTLSSLTHFKLSSK
jgi:O-antigen/teichoic acid export membrane protein